MNANGLSVEASNAHAEWFKANSTRARRPGRLARLLGRLRRRPTADPTMLGASGNARAIARGLERRG